ncbi:MAG: DUF6691 family protein [Cycloclasticus sp.]
MDILLAIFIGLLFGFSLQKVGAANPQVIIDMLRLRNFHLMKAILLGIGLSSLSLFVLMNLGLVESAHLSVKTAYVGVIIGGAIMGAGWAIAGFCPGTGIVAMGAGRKDALFFVIGGLAGALIFTLAYAVLEKTFLFDKIGAGKATLASTGVEQYATLLDTVPAVVVVGVIALVFIFAAWKLPAKAINAA